MNTAELVDEVAAQTGMAKDGVRKVLDAVLGAVAEAAKAGQAVMLSGFGQFKVQDRAARQGRNPATGETIEIAASRKLAFTAAKPLRDQLSPGRQSCGPRMQRTPTTSRGTRAC